MAANALSAMGEVLDGHIAVGLDEISSAAYDAQQAGFMNVALFSFRDGASLAVRTMEHRRASRLLSDGLRYAESIDQSLCRHVMSATSALVAWADGDWVDAVDTARQVIADHGSRRSVTTARWAVGYVALGKGDLETAEAELSIALAVGRESGTIDLLLPPLWGLAEAALLAGHPDRTAELCHEALERARGTGERALLVPFVVPGVRAVQAVGRPSDAQAWLEACAEHLAPLPDVAGPALDHGRGLVALADGATGVARVALEAAVAGWDRHGRAWDRPGRVSTWPNAWSARTASRMRCRSPSSRGRRPSALARPTSRIGRTRCCGWPAVAPRTTSHGDPSPRASSKWRGSSVRA